MGSLLSCCFPKQVFYKKVKGNGTGIRNGSLPIQESVTEPTYTESVFKNFNEIAGEILLLGKNIPQKGDIIERSGEIIERSGEKIEGSGEEIERSGENSPIIEMDGNVFHEELRIPEDFVFTDQVMSEDELESILNSCSTSPYSQNTNEGVAEDGSDRDHSDHEMECDSITDVERALIARKHIGLCRAKEDFPQLQSLMQGAMKEHILDTYIDEKDEYGNTAVSVALLSSNAAALLYLVKKCFAEVPILINDGSNVFLFLICLARNRELRLMESERRQFLLFTVMKEVASVKCEEYVEKFFLSVDPTYGFSLPHFLVELYLSGQCPTTEIKKCLELCVNQCRKCLFIQCPVNRQTDYKIDVIARLICLTNVQNVSIVVDLLKFIRKACGDHFVAAAVYRKIVAAHRDSPFIQEQLMPLFL